MIRFFLKKLLVLIGVSLLLGFNNAHPGMLGDTGAEYPMTDWEAVPIGTVENQEQATWMGNASKVPVELYDIDVFLVLP